MSFDQPVGEQLAEHQDWVESLLLDDEEVMWYGQPLPSRFVRRGGVVVLLACFWIGAVGVGLWSQLRNLPYGFGDPEFPMIASVFIPLMAIGGYMITKPIRDVSRAMRIYYLVTNARAMVLITGKRSKAYAFSGEALNKLVVKVEADGSGDILFRETEHPVKVSRFLGVQDVASVAEMIRAL